MKILLLGGTGILSTDFTKKTLNEGNQVWILNRGKRHSFIDKRAHLVVADIRNESTEEIRGKFGDLRFDVIVDYLSFDPDQLKKSLTIFERKYSQYIFISSATAYIKTDTDIIREDTHKVGNKNWSYSYNKSLCEEFIIQSGINYTIVRPYVTYGESRIPFQLIPDGFHYTLIERIKNDKPVALLNNGEAICTLTNTIDFANILYGLLLNEKAYCEVFHITSQSQQTWKTVYETYCEILGKKPQPVSITMEDIIKYMPEYEESLKGDKGTTWRFDNSKVLSAIGGYEFQIDLKTGLMRSIDFYEKHEEMQGIDYKWDGKIDYMIAHVTGIRGLHKMDSSSSKNTDKKYYDIMKNPFTHNLYMTLWKIKHRNG